MRKALVLFLAGLSARLATATLPAAATPVRAQAGLRAYFVITAPGQTARSPARSTANGGTVYAAYDAIGVIVAHSAAADFATKMRAVNGVQKVGATRTSDLPADAANPLPPAPVPEHRTPSRRRSTAPT